MGSKRRALLVLLATVNCVIIMPMLFHQTRRVGDGGGTLSPTARPSARSQDHGHHLAHATPRSGPPGFLPDVPVLILAHNRSAYLKRSLESVLAAAGVTPANILVSIDGQHPDTEQVARSLGIRIAALPQSQGQPAGRVCFHYKRSLALAFERQPAARYVIVLEEDLQVARDFFSYFQQTIPLLELDPTLLLISAWNDQGYVHASNDVDSSQVFRVERMSGLGWVCSRTLFEELEPKWPATAKNWDWDQWLRLESVSQGRDTVIPSISRTHHFGGHGVHMTPAFQHLYFDGRRLNTEHPVMRVNGASSAEGYDRELARFISGAMMFPTSPCSASLHPGQDYVLFIKQGPSSDAGEPDYSNWLKLARCFKIWDLDVRGQYKRYEGRACQHPRNTGYCHNLETPDKLGFQDVFIRCWPNGPWRPLLPGYASTHTHAHVTDFPFIAALSGYSTWRLWWQQSRVVVVGSNSPFARPLTDSSAIRCATQPNLLVPKFLCESWRND